MTDDERTDPAGRATGATGDPGAPTGPHEQVGSVGEEAAKLFGALSDWAREHAGDPGPAGEALAHAAPWDDVAHGGPDASAAPGEPGAAPECRWCPVCRTVHLVRQTSPEVKAHLAQAAGSLVQAAAGLLATYTTATGPTGPNTGARGAQVEKIDRDDDSDWDEDQD